MRKGRVFGWMWEFWELELGGVSNCFARKINVTSNSVFQFQNNTQTTELDGEYENPARTPCSTAVKYVDNKWVYIKDGEVIKVEDSQPVDDLTKPLQTGKTSDDLAMKAHWILSDFE